jgi:hypothetical protein
MIKKNLRNLIIVTLMILPVKCFSQSRYKNRVSKNTFFTELSINSDIYLSSVIYDRLLKPKGVFNVGLQAGITYSKSITTAYKGYSILYPVKCYIMVGSKRHKFETGFGARILTYPWPEINIGYRYKPINNGFSFRAGYNVVVFPVGLSKMANVSIGYAF